MDKITIEIDKDTFEHALNNLNFNEIMGILDSYSITVKEKKSKTLLKKELLDKIGELGENVYYAIKSKAFSVNFDFFDGFFYKYNNKNTMLSKKNFYTAAKEIIDSYEGDIKFDITEKNDDINNDTIKFTINRYNRKAVYDPDQERSRFYNQQIQAKVEIILQEGLVYIHSKNATDATAIKVFLQKVLKKKDYLLNEKISMKLQCPKFNNEIVDQWIKEKSLTNNRISAMTLNMLDLLHSFNKADTEFRGFGMRKIFFEHEAIDTQDEDCTVTGMIFDGVNLQKHQDILKEIMDGKKIKGFSIEVEHCYFNEDDEQELLSIIPITIMHENNQSIRISIASESLSVDHKILNKAYADVKNVFMEKLNATQVVNDEEVLQFVKKLYDKTEVVSIIQEENNTITGNEDRMVL